jgi:anti-sigma regulatory factor (Ser/Thr protein kinase)
VNVPPSDDDIDVGLDLPAELDLLWPLNAFARELLLGVRPPPARKSLDEVLLVLHEAFTNVCRHAYAGQTGGRVVVTMRVGANTMEIRLQDTGRSFNLESWKEPDMDRMSESGRGVWLMKRLTDRLEYTSTPEGANTLQLVKNLERGSGE